MQNIYISEEYSERNPTYHVEDSAWKANHIGTMLSRHALKPGKVCEVGCGVGEILRLMQQQMPEAVLLHGFDISPSAIARANERANARLKFFCGDFLSEGESSYDLLLCMDVIEHVDDYIGFLKRLRARATFTIFHFPLDLSAQTVLRGKPLLIKRKKLGHLHYFTKDTVLETLDYAGYQVIDSAYTGSGVDKAHTFLATLLKYPRLMLSKINDDFTARTLGGYSLLVLATQKVVSDNHLMPHT